MAQTDTNFSEKKKEEVDQNFEFFEKQLPELIKTDRGKYALLKGKEIKGIFSNLDDAYQASNLIEDGLFSIQKIDTRARNLGYYSYAMV